MEYEINNETLALIPITATTTKVVELENVYLIKKSVMEIISDSCNYFGSSLEGRLQGSKSMLGSIYKAPIIIEESNNIIFFPTMSPQQRKTSWISHKNILKCEKKRNKTVIYFKNSKKIELNVPYLSISNQIVRSTLLESISKNRKTFQKTAIN